MHKLSKHVRHAIGASQPFCQENLFSKKNTKKQPFLCEKYRHHLTLGRSGGQTVDTRSIFGVALKTLGYNGSN